MYITIIEPLTYFQSLILAAVEGVTEFLPISSTAHLKVAEVWLNANAGEFYLWLLQFAAMLATIWVYKREIFQILFGLLRLDTSSLKKVRNLFLGFLPAAIIGYLLKDFVVLYLSSAVLMATMLMLGGIVMVAVCFKESSSASRVGKEFKTWADLTPSKVLIIGFVQSLAIIPGVSRLLMSLLGGYYSGLSLKQSIEYSYLLGLLTTTAAIVYLSVKSDMQLTLIAGNAPLILGFCATLLISIGCMGWILRRINFKLLGILGAY